MDAEIVADAGNVERQHLVEERRVGKDRDHHPDDEGKGGEGERKGRKRVEKRRRRSREIRRETEGGGERSSIRD